MKNTKKERKVKKLSVKTKRDESKEKPTVKIRKLPISNISGTYSVSLKISKANTLKETLHIPDFLLSVLSMGKINIGHINISSSQAGDGKYLFKISFIPSYILQLISRHKSMSYSACVLYDKQKGYVTETTHFIEEKIDGRKYEKSENLDGEKDPISLILDFMGAENRESLTELQSEDIELPFDINPSESRIEIFPKTDEAKLIFSSLRIDFENKGGIKFPSFISLEGLFSFLSILIEKAAN